MCREKESIQSSITELSSEKKGNPRWVAFFFAELSPRGIDRDLKRVLSGACSHTAPVQIPEKGKQTDQNKGTDSGKGSD